MRIEDEQGENSNRLFCHLYFLHFNAVVIVIIPMIVLVDNSIPQNTVYLTYQQ